MKMKMGIESGKMSEEDLKMVRAKLVMVGGEYQKQVKAMLKAEKGIETNLAPWCGANGFEEADDCKEHLMMIVGSVAGEMTQECSKMRKVEKYSKYLAEAKGEGKEEESAGKE